MAISSSGMMVSQSNKVVGDSFSVAVENDLEVGQHAVLVVAMDNVSLDNSETSDVLSIQDDAGNSWSRLAEYTHSHGVAGDGATVSVWRTKATAKLSSGGNLTVNLSAAVAAKAVTGWIFDATENVLILESYDVGYEHEAGPPIIALHSLSGSQLLLVRADAVEQFAGSYTPDAGYTAFDHVGASTAGGAATSNIQARCEFRIAISTGDTTQPSMPDADIASVMLALAERPAFASRVNFTTESLGKSVDFTGETLISSN